MRDLDPDEVSAIYEDLEMTYQIEWRRRGHRSMHLGYYDDEDQDPGEAAKNTVRLLSEAVGIDSGDRVLDVGCGAGEGAVWNAQVNGATVLGVDIGGRQLELARENAREHDVEERVSFALDNFHELTSVPDGSMDVVWGLEALSHSPDRVGALEQFRRVLAADGRVAFTDIFLRSPTDDDRVREVEDALGLRLGTIDAFERALEETGFENASVRDETDGVRPSTESRRQFARVAHPVGRVLGLVGLITERQLDAFRASSLVHELVEESLLGYYLVTADRGETGTNTN
ncbi:MAG: methyltransferase domain protein [halophilic archaeon J07HX64]|jgi:Cyclopropane fatty acid synthase and related methyltransferases|nr:MAG: methyltransferase domain protein [halophilic archaeon J07HX64]